MMAAITAARLGADVCLVERNPKLGRKLYITGRGGATSPTTVRRRKCWLQHPEMGNSFTAP